MHMQENSVSISTKVRNDGDMKGGKLVDTGVLLLFQENRVAVLSSPSLVLIAVKSTVILRARQPYSMIKTWQHIHQRHPRLINRNTPAW